MRPTVSQRRTLPGRAGRRGPRRQLAATAALVLSVALVHGCGAGDGAEDGSAAPASQAPFAWPEGPHPTVTLHVEQHGDVTVELFPELAPKTVENFLALADSGFYDGTTFHRVIPEFMIQGGDPLSRDQNPSNDGYGGPGYTIPDEINGAPHVRGALSMANNGRPGTAGSQFFILHRDARHLDGQHTLFGRVVDGIEVVDRIAAVETDVNGRWGKRHRPLEHVVVAGATVRGPDATAHRGAASESPPRG